MSRISPFRAVALLFFLPIALGQLLSPLWSDTLARHLLQQKMTQVEEAQQQRKIMLDTSIKELTSRLQFDCGPQDMARLRDPYLYHSYFRIVGIKLASGAGCSSLGPAVDMVDNALPHPLLYNFGFTTTADKFGTEQETVIFFKTGNNQVYWVLNSGWINELLQGHCHDCFYIEYHYQDPQMSALFLPRGPVAIKAEPDPWQSNAAEIDMGAQYTLWAGQALRKHASKEARYDSLWIGMLVGTLLVISYLVRRHYRYSLQGLLHQGLQQHEFLPYYQPVIDLRRREVVGVEALLRWQRDGELISPGTFIDYAEAQGLILPMTEQLLAQVITDLPQLPGMWISVNIVSAHVEDDHLHTLLQQHQWPTPSRLTFELTERRQITDMPTAASTITRLAQHGYGFKLDDFGTGYGGFAYLQQLGINQIKIDKMFVDTIGTSDLKRNVLDAIIAFGKESGMEMIAEGVETREQADYLYQHGVYLIQGYVFAKPMPLADLKSWLQQWPLSQPLPPPGSDHHPASE